MSKMVKLSDPVYEMLRGMKRDPSQSFNDVIVELIEKVSPTLWKSTIWGEQKRMTEGDIRHILDEYERKQDERLHRSLDEHVGYILDELQRKQGERLEQYFKEWEKRQEALHTTEKTS